MTAAHDTPPPWEVDGLHDPAEAEYRASLDHLASSATEPSNSWYRRDQEPSPVSYRERMLSLADLADLPAPTPIVHGLLDLDSVALVYGRRATYKSFLAVDWTSSVALGERWHGARVESAPVINVVAEGASGILQRYGAWQTEHAPLRQLAGPDRLLILPEAVNLMSPAAVGAFAEAAAEMGAKLIVIDTLARCMVGGDENSARDAGIAIEQLDVIRRRTGACVVVVHHTGKDLTAGGRGSSAFEAAVDTVLEIATVDDVMTIRCTKQKNHAEPNPIRLQLVARQDSAVLVSYRPTSDVMPAGVLETLAALSDIEVTGGVPATAWRLSSAKPEPTFFRHRKDLLALGLVSNVGTDKQPRYQVSDAGTLTLSEDSHGSR